MSNKTTPEVTEAQSKKIRMVASRIFVHSILLNEVLDEAADIGLFRHMLKKKANEFNKELEGSIEMIFKNGVNPSDLLAYSAKVSLEVENILNTTLEDLA